MNKKNKRLSDRMRKEQIDRQMDERVEKQMGYELTKGAKLTQVN